MHSSAYLYASILLLCLPLNKVDLSVLKADEVTDPRRELQLLREQNEALQRQMRKQAEQLDRLTKIVTELQDSVPKSQPQKPQTSDLDPSTPQTPRQESIFRSAVQESLGKVHISGQGGLAFFSHESNGRFPDAAFRADEAYLFVEAPVFEDIYLFSETKFFRREDLSQQIIPGEIYLDFENLSRWWNQESQLSLRMGRLDIPFGEEYLSRDASDNRLISHSLSDFWGIDEGVEVYGTLKHIQYVLAVQNGGHPSINDYNSDKSVTLRLGGDPVKWLHLGVSLMRTGDLDVKNDQLSELWFGNGFFRSVGSTNTTTFEANLVQGDTTFRWQNGHLGLSGGAIQYSDNDPRSSNSRTVFFYSTEVVQYLSKKFYLAGRFSEIWTDRGFPMVGDGGYSKYLNQVLTKDLWRFSIGVGYQIGPSLLLKAEYSINRGHEANGNPRDQENLSAVEASFKF